LRRHQCSTCRTKHVRYHTHGPYNFLDRVPHRGLRCATGKSAMQPKLGTMDPTWTTAMHTNATLVSMVIKREPALKRFTNCEVKRALRSHWSEAHVALEGLALAGALGTATHSLCSLPCQWKGKTQGMPLMVICWTSPGIGASSKSGRIIS
jgi:hypothetical protein